MSLLFVPTPLSSLTSAIVRLAMRSSSLLVLLLFAVVTHYPALDTILYRTPYTEYRRVPFPVYRDSAIRYLLHITDLSRPELQQFTTDTLPTLLQLSIPFNIRFLSSRAYNLFCPALVYRTQSYSTVPRSTPVSASNQWVLECGWGLLFFGLVQIFSIWEYHEADVCDIKIWNITPHFETLPTCTTWSLTLPIRSAISSSLAHFKCAVIRVATVSLIC